MLPTTSLACMPTRALPDTMWTVRPGSGGDADGVDATGGGGGVMSAGPVNRATRAAAATVGLASAHGQVLSGQAVSAKSDCTRPEVTGWDCRFAGVDPARCLPR